MLSKWKKCLRWVQGGLCTDCCHNQLGCKEPVNFNDFIIFNISSNDENGVWNGEWYWWPKAFEGRINDVDQIVEGGNNKAETEQGVSSKPREEKGVEGEEEAKEEEQGGGQGNLGRQIQ